MTTTATRLTSLAAALLSGATLATAVAAPAMAAPAPATVQNPTPNATGAPQWVTKGVEVLVRNDGDQTLWVRKWHWQTDFYWESPVAINPGSEARFTGKSSGTDDLELRVFLDEGKAHANEDGIEVDAENPAYSTPWMSVDWDSEYFNIGGTHTWVADDGSRYWGKREDDSYHYKRFRLHVTNP